MESRAVTGAAAGAKPCPICAKPAAKAFAPFCSARCADVDLHRWLSGNYAIPGRAAEDADDASGETRPTPVDPKAPPRH